MAKLISKNYKLAQLDTGKIYRLIAYYKIKYPNKFNLKFLKKKIYNLKISQLSNKTLLNDEIGLQASIVAKKKSIRKLVHAFQVNFAYNPPKKFNGSCLDGRDITYNIVPDADIKLFITASLKVRARRRYKELKALKKDISFEEVLKSIKKGMKTTIIEKFHLW